MPSDFETIAHLTARIVTYIDLRRLDEVERADLMGAITGLAEFTPTTPASSRPPLVVRLPLCTPLEAGGCSAGNIDENGLNHCCINAPGHDGQHLCTCGLAWSEADIPQVIGQCGAFRDAGFGHTCVCHLETHNTVPADLGEVPLHSCATCGQPWTVSP